MPGTLYINVRQHPPDNNKDMKNFKMFWWKLRMKFGSPKLLCDTCEYDYPSACYNPKRPNATTCPDYKRR